ncbi:right-handed parallel beta-helix repeat-containing protein [bacterium]|nr:right-handed parallel beta-helix repeat-containing protein [bacterium]
MRRDMLIFLLSILMIIASVMSVKAQLSETINYQGNLMDNSTGQPVNGFFDVFFEIREKFSNVLVWNEVQNVEVIEGIYNVQLGTNSPLNIDFSDGLKLRVAIDENGNGVMEGNEVLSPDSDITVVPLAFQAKDAAALDGKTASDFAGVIHEHPTGDINIGVFTDERIPANITRDNEVVSQVLLGDGPNSGLDADLLDSKDSSAFMEKADYDVDSNGITDTVDAPLNLTGLSNGFTAGVVSGEETTMNKRGALGVAQYGAYGEDLTSGNWGGLGNGGVGIYGAHQASGNQGGIGSATEGVMGQNPSAGTQGSLATALYGVYGINSSGPAAGFDGDVHINGAGKGIVFNDGSRQETAAMSASVYDADGNGAADNADRLGTLTSADIIDAAADEVRTPISACGTVITNSGSYYLTGNLSGSGDCIHINIDNVSLDMMGFTITGDSTGRGIYISGHSQVSIRNGIIQKFTQGIYAQQFFNGTARGITLDSLHVLDNVAQGIVLNSFAQSINNTIVSGNGSTGISVDQNTIIHKCTVYDNEFGIFAQEQTVISETSAYKNTSGGIAVGKGSTVTNSAAYENGGTGIQLRNAALKDSNVHKNAGMGVNCDNYCVIADNSVTNNGSEGINTGSGSTVRNNAIGGNTGPGIDAFSDANIIENTVNGNNIGNFNNQGGITVGSGSIVKANLVSGNQINNIYVTGTNNVLDENMVIGSGSGIKFTADGNYYIRNRASDNTTDFDLGVTTQTAGSGNASF